MNDCEPTRKLLLRWRNLALAFSFALALSATVILLGSNALGLATLCKSRLGVTYGWLSLSSGIWFWSSNNLSIRFSTKSRTKHSTRCQAKPSSNTSTKTKAKPITNTRLSPDASPVPNPERSLPLSRRPSHVPSVKDQDNLQDNLQDAHQDQCKPSQAKPS